MRSWARVFPAAVVAVVALGMGQTRGGELPKVEELLAKATAKLSEVKSMEADIQMTVQSGGKGQEITGHLVMQISEKDGKMVKRECLSVRESTTMPNGRNSINEGKVVDDGTAIWLEEHRAGDKQVRVTKNGPRGDEQLWPEHMLERAKALPIQVALTVTGEEPVDGQKMYVLEGTDRPEQGPMKEHTRKLWIGEEDLLLHRWMESWLYEGKDQGRGETLTYMNMKVDQKVDEEMFEYTPPAGAVVEDLTKK